MRVHHALCRYITRGAIANANAATSNGASVK